MVVDLAEAVQCSRRFPQASQLLRQMQGFVAVRRGWIELSKPGMRHANITLDVGFEQGMVRTFD